MYCQGWNKKSIAGCIHLSRRHVARLIETFNREGFAGLEDLFAFLENETRSSSPDSEHERGQERQSGGVK